MYRIAAPKAEQVRREAAELFKEAFHREPNAVVLAPGRVNLIGEHIDYNEGIVLPFALELQTAVAIAPCDESKARLISTSDREPKEYSTLDPKEKVWEEWTRYIQGVWHYWKLSSAFQTSGFELAVASSVPVGAGLSSSAALCIATLLALAKIKPHQLTGPAVSLTVLEQAMLCQQVEHHFAGVRCGLMDQLASLACQSNHLLSIDFRGPKLAQIPWPVRELACLLVHTGVQHQLASSEYGQRRAECESAARKLGLSSLRDCTLDELEVASQASEQLSLAPTISSGNAEGSANLTGLEYLRARHVISEINRTKQAIQACREGNAVKLGELMNASHRSLRDDYQVSCEELDFLVEEISRLPGVFGARMTGGGFGGSMIALIDPRRDWEKPLEQLLERYAFQFNSPPRWLLCRPSAGALELERTEFESVGVVG